MFIKTDLNINSSKIKKAIESINYYQIDFFINWSVFKTSENQYALVENDTKQMLFLGTL